VFLNRALLDGLESLQRESSIEAFGMYLIVNLVEDGWCGIAAKRVRHLSIWY
jgi:hypothetical protein